MKTLNLKEAAAFLHMHPYTLMQKVHAGLIPGAKPGKRWVFVEDDLVDYLRSQYRPASSLPSMQACGSGSIPEPLSKGNFKKGYLDVLGLADCPQIHNPKPGARSGASHAHAARRVA